MANHKRHSDDGGRGSSRRGGARHNHGSDGVRSHPRKRTPIDPQAAFAALESRLRAYYGDETTAVIMEGYRAERPVTLRANTLKTTPDAVRAALEEAGIACRTVPWSPNAFIVEGAREDAVRALPLYERGDVYLQSLSSMVPPLVLSPGPGDAVLDMAAAPGGKTTQMAALSGGQAQITACERSAPRAERLRFNLERQGAGRVSVLVQDARRLDPFFRFGKILLDAPCSGSGTVSTERTASAAEGGMPADSAAGSAGSAAVVWKTGFSEELLSNCVRTQAGLLRKALELLPPGGELVYSTCSILPEENELLVQRVLEEAAQGARPQGKKGARGRSRGLDAADAPTGPIRADIVPIDPARVPGMPLLPCTLEGALCIRPSELYEGFFVCHLRRR